MSDIKNVLLIGAGGNLGPAILNEFLASPFNVSVLTRPDSTSTFPPSVNVITSSYELDSLVSAFKGQDAVISLVGTPGFSSQKLFVDAAIAAGVRRFIPSEYGTDTASAKVRSLMPIFDGKRAVVEYLQSAGEPKGLSWTALIPGFFFDWGLKVGFLGFDIQGRKATIWDDGNAAFHTTTLSHIGKALVALLSTPDRLAKTKNTYVYVKSAETSQNEILAALEKKTGAKWAVEKTSTEGVFPDVTERLLKGDFGAFAPGVLAITYGKEGLGRWEKVWNEELGLGAEDVESVVAEVVDGKRP
ncbi:NmrA-like family protein [Saccharata proteae CBS 121410]|uniref:NmrA-like family protein n=1 Tax=Saccharata proteae CBS 121410 TaxID=1314787 RepID=A0A9P4LT21_9PEZI|nr:NmrA-like family protein [Saccharata proteae CBS 121410]